MKSYEKICGSCEMQMNKSAEHLNLEILHRQPSVVSKAPNSYEQNQVNTAEKLEMNSYTSEQMKNYEKNSWIVRARYLIAECWKSILRVGFSMGIN